jgi:hypothetical protein
MTTLPASAAGLTRRRYDAAFVSRSVGAGAATVAAAVHLYVTPEHLREWWLYGGFFVAVTVAQAVLALLLVRGPGIGVVLLAVWGTVWLIAIYVVSRTVGLPITPPVGAAVHGGHSHAPGVVGSGVPVLPGSLPPGVEPVAALDLLALGAELLLLLVLVGMLPSAVRRVTINLMLVAGVVGWGVVGILSLG